MDATDEIRTDVELRPQTTELTRILFICAAAALAAALISGRWALIAFAAPLLGVLSSAGWQRPLKRIAVRSGPRTLRCFEGDSEQVVVELETPWRGGSAALSVTAHEGMRTEGPDSADPYRRTVFVSADRWGRYPLQARVDVVAPGGLLAASGSADIGEAFVFPLVPPPSTAMPRAEMLDRIGTPLTRHVG
ncbi:MAG: DUF58 domain-containing protein, partial [Mycobacterium sp.]|nr:DUF58 domain-containing protein [Mycobacterium sp.]